MSGGSRALRCVDAAADKVPVNDSVSCAWSGMQSAEAEGHAGRSGAARKSAGVEQQSVDRSRFQCRERRLPRRAGDATVQFDDEQPDLTKDVRCGDATVPWAKRRHVDWLAYFDGVDGRRRPCRPDRRYNRSPDAVRIDPLHRAARDRTDRDVGTSATVQVSPLEACVALQRGGAPDRAAAVHSMTKTLSRDSQPRRPRRTMRRPRPGRRSIIPGSARSAKRQRGWLRLTCRRGTARSREAAARHLQCRRRRTRRRRRMKSSAAATASGQQYSAGAPHPRGHARCRDAGRHRRDARS